MNSHRRCWVCQKSKKKYFLESSLVRNTYARYHICLMRVFILLLSIRYNVCVYQNPVPGILRSITTSPLLPSTSHNVYTCHSPKYHYIIVSVVYLVYYSCIIAVRVSWFSDHRACISDEQSAQMLGVLEIEEFFFLESGLVRNTYARCHICLMRVFILLLSIRYNVCVYHNPVYHYITATAAYLTQRVHLSQSKISLHYQSVCESTFFKMYLPSA